MKFWVTRIGFWLTCATHELHSEMRDAIGVPSIPIFGLTERTRIVIDNRNEIGD